MIFVLFSGALLFLANAQPPHAPAVHCWAHLSSALFYDSESLAVWQLDSVSGSNHIRAKSLNDTSGKSDTMISVLNWTGFEGWNATVKFPPDLGLYIGSIEQSDVGPTENMCSRASFTRHSGSREEPSYNRVSWEAGPKPEGLQRCIFKKAPFYHQNEGSESWPGWAQVVEFNSLNESAFTITSLNGSFREATATIKASSGYNSVGAVTIQNSTGTTQYSFTLRGEGAPGQASYCSAIAFTAIGQPSRSSIEWQAGAAPVPPMQPCPDLYDEKNCQNAWLNKCSWCTSSDKLHELCFPAEQAKMLPQGKWSCTSTETAWMELI